jgi:hypothetical protein
MRGRGERKCMREGVRRSEGESEGEGVRVIKREREQEEDTIHNNN